MASKYQIQNNYDSLVITKPWRSGITYFLGFFAFFWNAIVIAALVGGVGIFAIIHVLVGFFVGWYAIAGFLNKTTIRVSDRELDIQHGPVPWPLRANKNIKARSLVQLYVKKSSVRVNGQATYNLVAELDSKVKINLLTNERDKDTLLELETAIESYLGIENDVTKGYQTVPLDTLDLEEFNAQMERLEPLMKWLPGGMVKQIEASQKEMMRRRKGGQSLRHPRSATERDTSTPTSPIPPAKPDTASRMAVGDSKRVYVPAQPILFPLYGSPANSYVNWNEAKHRIGQLAQLDFENADIPTARQIELVPQDGSERRYLYAQEENDRWTYYEERRLDDAEASKLGFDAFGVTDAFPARVNNADERYYPRAEQVGTRFFSNAQQPFRQAIYYTISSATQFRALLPRGKDVEVYVQEVVDAGEFNSAG